MAAVVADASVLIALRQIGQIALLEKLFGGVLIPPAVAREIAPSLPRLPHWVRIREVGRPLHAPVEDALLDPGETEAIQLALRTNAEWVILDDLPARRLASELGLPIVGTAGILFLAKQRGLIEAVRPALDALRAVGFRLRRDVYEEILRSADEVGEAS